jgi:heme/copper-type cytochrome/quinol oxidase subunit 2
VLICSAIAGIVVGIVVVLIGVSVIILIVILKERKKKKQQTYSSLTPIGQNINTNNEKDTPTNDLRSIVVFFLNFNFQMNIRFSLMK